MTQREDDVNKARWQRIHIVCQGRRYRGDVVSKISTLRKHDACKVRKWRVYDAKGSRKQRDNNKAKRQRDHYISKYSRQSEDYSKASETTLVELGEEQHPH